MSTSPKKSSKRPTESAEHQSYANLLSDDYSPAPVKKKTPQKPNTVNNNKNPATTTNNVGKRSVSNNNKNSAAAATAASSRSSSISSYTTSTASTVSTSNNTSSSVVTTDSENSSAVNGRKGRNTDQRTAAAANSKKRPAAAVKASKAPPSRGGGGSQSQTKPTASSKSVSQSKNKNTKNNNSQQPKQISAAPKRSPAEIARSLIRLQSSVLLDKEEISVEADAELHSIWLSHIRLLETKKQRALLKQKKQSEVHQYRAQILEERIARIQTEEDSERENISRMERQHTEALIRMLERDLKEDIALAAQQETLKEKYWNRTYHMVLRGEVSNRKNIVFTEGHTRIQIAQAFEDEISKHLLRIRKDAVVDAKKKQTQRVKQWEKSYKSFREQKRLEESQKISSPTANNSNSATAAVPTTTKSTVSPISSAANKQASRLPPSDIPKDDQDKKQQQQQQPPKQHNNHHDRRKSMPLDLSSTSSSDEFSPVSSSRRDSEAPAPGDKNNKSPKANLGSDDEPSPQRPGSEVPSTARGSSTSTATTTKAATTKVVASNEKQQQPPPPPQQPRVFVSATSHLQRFTEEENERIRDAHANLELDRREEIEFEEESVRNSIYGTLNHNLVLIVEKLEKEGAKAIERSKHALQRHVQDISLNEYDKRQKIESEEEANWKFILRKYEKAAAVEWKRYDENVVRHLAHERKLVERQRRIDARRVATMERVEMNRRLIQMTDPSTVKVNNNGQQATIPPFPQFTSTSYFSGNNNNNNHNDDDENNDSDNNTNRGGTIANINNQSLIIFEGLVTLKPKPPTTAPAGTSSVAALPLSSAIGGTTTTTQHQLSSSSSLANRRYDSNSYNNPNDHSSSNAPSSSSNQQQTQAQTARRVSPHQNGTSTSKTGRPDFVVSTARPAFNKHERRNRTGFLPSIRSVASSSVAFTGNTRSTFNSADGGAGAAATTKTKTSNVVMNNTAQNPPEILETQKRLQLANLVVQMRNLANREKKKREDIEKQQRMESYRIFDENTEKEYIEDRLFKAKFKREIEEEDRFTRAEEKVRQDDLRGQFTAAFLEREKILSQRIKAYEAHERHERLELIAAWKEDFDSILHEKNEMLRSMKLFEALENEEKYWRKALQQDALRQKKGLFEAIQDTLGGNKNGAVDSTMAKSFAQPTHHQKKPKRAASNKSLKKKNKNPDDKK